MNTASEGSLHEYLFLILQLSVQIVDGKCELDCLDSRPVYPPACTPASVSNLPNYENENRLIKEMNKVIFAAVLSSAVLRI